MHAKSRQYRKKLPIGIDEPDYFCFLAYSSTVVAKVSAMYPDAKKVDFVVSKKGKLTTRLQVFHEEMRRLMPEYEDLIGELIPATMEERLPLQAADLLCWHIQRYYANTMDAVDQRRLAVLMHDLDGYPHTWERKDIEEFTENVFKRFT